MDFRAKQTRRAKRCAENLIFQKGGENEPDRKRRGRYEVAYTRTPDTAGTMSESSVKRSTFARTSYCFSRTSKYCEQRWRVKRPFEHSLLDRQVYGVGADVKDDNVQTRHGFHGLFVIRTGTRVENGRSPSMDVSRERSLFESSVQRSTPAPQTSPAIGACQSDICHAPNMGY